MVKSYGFIIVVSLGIGLAVSAPLLWYLRKEAIFGWREQFGSGGGDDEGSIKDRLDRLRAMEPIGWGIVVLLTAILILTMFVFGIVVVYGGVVLSVGGFIVIIALIVIFNVVLFAQIPPLQRKPDPSKFDDHLSRQPGDG